ncbi:putative small membrane protein [Streptomyces scabiei 87.22]|uniref:Putative small membrane protein n=1 Tax=Streptomyces scabiei (strain 87.22) TaxID=680198 RepID=C9YW15_STRSW|nr:putative small membrane protein [Streptomyces scabiei 87.22]
MYARFANGLSLGVIAGTVMVTTELIVNPPAAMWHPCREVRCLVG